MRFSSHALPRGWLGEACGGAGCLHHDHHVARSEMCAEVTHHATDNVSVIRPTRAVFAQIDLHRQRSALIVGDVVTEESSK